MDPSFFVYSYPSKTFLEMFLEVDTPPSRNPLSSGDDTCWRYSQLLQNLSRLPLSITCNLLLIFCKPGQSRDEIYVQVQLYFTGFCLPHSSKRKRIFKLTTSQLCIYNLLPCLLITRLSLL